MPTSSPAFADLFSPATKADWLAQVQKDLKDPNAYESLRWPTPEGFTLEPYYTADDVVALPLTEGQAAQKTGLGWLNAPALRSDNAALRDALQHGADALVLPNVVAGQLPRLLDGIRLSDTPVFFGADDHVVDVVKTLRNVAPYQVQGGLLTDPIAHYVRTGQPPANAYANVVAVTRLTADAPRFRTVCAESHPFHNAGATATQELALLLANLADQYDALTERGLSMDELLPKTVLSVSVGTSYFLEIAKLRALRVLLRRLLAAYQPALSQLPFIHAQTSSFYQAAATPYTNLLRATTEAMAAVIGGCDALTVHPYDTALDAQSSAFAERIARNVSVLLKEEAHLDKVADPAAGSSYVEATTYQLVEAAWPLFLRIEELGGLTRALATGFVQDEIERAYGQKVEAVRNGRVLVGVTKFRHDEPGVVTPGVATPLRSDDSSTAPATTFAPLLPDRRLTQAFE